jgi:iron(III) transport system permease protein
MVGGLMLLPPAYLLIRTLGVSEAAAEILLKPSTLQTVGRTVWLAGSVTLASVLLAVPLAWLTACTDLPGRRLWLVLTALPLVLPSFVAAYLMASMLGPKGLLQQILEPLIGVQRLPAVYGFPGAFIVLTLMSYPYVLLTVHAALRRMDPSQVEAARSLGVSSWGAFWRVTLPQLRPAIVAGSLLVILYVLRDFGAVTMMRYGTFTRMIYIQYQSFTDRSLAAALAMVLIGMTAVILYLEILTRGRAQYARHSIGAARQLKPVKLGWWRWPALLFVIGVVLIALAGPALSLLYWLVRGWIRGQEMSVLWQSSWNSMLVSLVTAVVAIVAALPAAILSVRKPTGYIHFLERLTYAGYALPGIVIALAFVFFGTHYARSLYQTLPILVMAYMVLFIPQAVGATRSSLLQVPKSLEEAGRSLGQRPGQVFQRITLPLLRPGVLAGLGLVFLTSMKELPATLILSPIGFRTLATTIWGNISEAFFAQAAAPALALILLSSIPLAILTFRDDS